MFWSALRRNQPLRGVAIALAVWLFLALLGGVGLFQAFDLRLSDWRFHLRGQRPAADRIAIVEVDDATVRAYGRWPLPREAYGLLISLLEDGGARAIGVDIQFPAPAPNEARGDTLLTGVTAISRAVVHALSFFADPPAEEDGERNPALAALAAHGLPADGIDAPEAASASLPFADLARAAWGLGHVTVAVDGDGVVRRLPMLVRYEDRLHVAMALRLLGPVDGDSGRVEARPVRGGVDVAWPGGRRLYLPCDGEGATAIDYAGDRQVFRHRYSVLELLSWFRRGELDSIRHAVGGRIVLIGATAVREVATDIGATPFSPSTPLIYVHANAVDAALRGRFLRPVSPWVHQGVLVLLAVTLGWCFALLPIPRAAGLMAGVTLGLAALNQALFVWWGWNVPPSPSLLLPPLAYMGVASYRYVFQERKARERDREMNLARKIQQKLLPVTPPDVGGLDIHGFNIPAHEVGGDYFDWILLPDGTLSVALGDVSGKGVSAALLMSHLRASLHAETRPGRPPAEVALAMNQSLERAVEPNRFATFFLCSFAADGASFRYASAGHNPVLHVRAAGADWLGATGIPLGMMSFSTYKEEERSFGAGDLLVIYSDGVTEYPFKEDEYGEERLERLLATLNGSQAPAATVASAILADVRAFARGGPAADDITIVVVRRT